MRRSGLRSWHAAALAAVGIAVGVALIGGISTSSAASQAKTVRVAIMTDCKGAFGFGYEPDIGGAEAALARYAHGKAKNKKKPSAGMTGMTAGGANIKIVGYGCGNDTVPLAVTETKRLMEQAKADVMIGPLSGDEAVSVANYAKSHPKKTFIIGTAGSQDPTLQIAPKNMFRYHGDGAQWNAGTGEIDYCAMGGKITKRVFPPLNTTDYAPYIRQLPPPNSVDGYFWVVGGTGTGASLKAYEQAYGKTNPKKFVGNLFFAFLGNFSEVAPRLVGAYVGGFGTSPGLKTKAARAYEGNVAKIFPGLNGGNYADGFVYNYYNAAWALVQGLNKSHGALGAKLQSSLPRTLRPGYQVSGHGVLHLDKNRQAIQDQWPLQIVRKGGKPALTVVGFVPNVTQSFGGLFKKSSPPPGRTQPPCRKLKTPWQGKIRVVKNGVVTKGVIK